MSRRRIQPVTIVTPIRWVWALWLLASWPGARGNPLVLRPLWKLSFIHFAHWSLRLRTPHPYLVFHSNFDGDIEQYIDAFAEVVPGRMRLMWGGAYGWTGPQPVGAFKRFILGQAVLPPEHHYFAAYEHASSRTVRSALRLRARAERVLEETGDLGDEAFATAFRRYVHDVQEDL